MSMVERGAKEQGGVPLERAFLPSSCGCISFCNWLADAEEHTEEVTGPSWAEVPLAVKLTPLGALSLTSRAAAAGSVGVRQSQLERLTGSSVVEVLVDELQDGVVSDCVILELYLGSHKHTSLEALAMSLKAGGGNLGTIFSAMMKLFGGG